MSLSPSAWCLRALLVLSGCLALATAPARADDEPRFSSLLRRDQLTETGLDKLTTDNVAVIDALVRRDKTATDYHNNNIASTRFSQRRTEQERTVSGIYLLTPAQVQKLDDLVALRVAKPQAQFEASVPTPRLVFEPVNDVARPAEMHGSVSLTYGWGKGGSFRGGDANFIYTDPDKKYSVLFGYSEYKGKGYVPYYYPADGSYWYRPSPGMILPDR